MTLDAPHADQLVFFDLDRCLLLDDSIGGFVAHLVRRELAPRSALARGAVAYLLYRLNLGDPGGMVREGVRWLAGRAEQPIADAATEFFEEVIRFRYRPSLLNELEQHQALGRRCYLLTGGLPYIPRLVAQDLELDGAYTSIPEVQNGRFTGAVIEPPCVGADKLKHARLAVEEQHCALDDSWFYTDSYSDWSVLAACGVPIVVNPDGKLLKAARARGWRVLY